MTQIASDCYQMEKIIIQIHTELIILYFIFIITASSIKLLGYWRVHGFYNIVKQKPEKQRDIKGHNTQLEL